MGLELDGVNGILKNTTSDGDVTIKGNDGGSEISALAFDMSAAGAATFNAGITVNGTTTVVDDISISGATPSITLTDTDDNSDCMVYQAAGNLYLEADKNSEASGSFLRIAVDDLDMVHVYNGETVFNESSRDQDFRVESNGNTHMLFVDGGNDHVNIGTSSDLGATFNVKAPDNNTTQQLVLTDNDNQTKTHIGNFSNTTYITNNTHYNGSSWVKDDNAIGTSFIGAGDGSVNFGTSTDATPTVRMTIDSTRGMVLRSSSAVYIELGSAGTTGGNSANWIRASGNNIGLNTNGGTYGFEVSGSAKVNFAANGDVTNATGSYGTISDERIKQDITDANSQWDDIKALRVRNYKKKEDVRELGDSAPIHIGLVAQELETVSPNLVKTQRPTVQDIVSSSEFGTLYTEDDAETKDGDDVVLYTAEDQEVIDGDKNVGDIKTQATHTAKVGQIKAVTEEVKGIGYSILYMKAIKALQEAMAKIETLETKVAALEAE